MKRVLCLAVGLTFFAMSEARSAVPQNSDDNSILAVGGGVSAPSSTDAIADNPAGLGLNRRLKFLAGATADSKSFNPFAARGRMLLGNGLTGAALGAHSYKSGHQDRFALDAGFATYSDLFKSIVGIGGTTDLNSHDRPFEDTRQINVGFLSNPYGGTRVGAGLVGILGGIDYYTFGAATDIGTGGVFSVDTSSNRNFDGRVIQPAIGLRGQGLSVEAGYGFRLDKKAEPYIRKGFTWGANLALSKDLSIQATYNHHTKYYVALTACF